MNLVLQRSSRLPPGSVSLPGGVATEPVRLLRFGSVTAAVSESPGAPAGELWLAPDLWKRLSVPLDGMRLVARETAPGEVELGPVVTMVYAEAGSQTPAQAAARLKLYYGHLVGAPGLLAIGFADTIDWERSTMAGYVLQWDDGRPAAVRARFPLPAVARLAWSIPQDVIRQLRERTDGRTFNWVRNIGKWQFYNLLRENPDLSPHLPDTRLFRAPVDLMAMLARYDTVFVKPALGVRGQRMVRVRRLPEGFEARHMEHGQMVQQEFERFGDLVDHVQGVVGPGRVIAQQGVSLAGGKGRAMHFRVMVVRDAGGGWRLALTRAHVAPNQQLVFTNAHNGASEVDPLPVLQHHHGMTEQEAKACLARMVDLSLQAAEVLAVPFAPLGMLGFDLVLETGTGRLLFLEANSVPGWGYPSWVQTQLARSQADYALLLTGFQP